MARVIFLHTFNTMTQSKPNYNPAPSQPPLPRSQCTSLSGSEPQAASPTVPELPSRFPRASSTCAAPRPDPLLESLLKGGLRHGMLAGGGSLLVNALDPCSIGRISRSGGLPSTHGLPSTLGPPSALGLTKDAAISTLAVDLGLASTEDGGGRAGARSLMGCAYAAASSELPEEVGGEGEEADGEEIESLTESEPGDMVEGGGNGSGVGWALAAGHAGPPLIMSSLTNYQHRLHVQPVPYRVQRQPSCSLLLACQKQHEQPPQHQRQQQQQLVPQEPPTRPASVLPSSSMGGLAHGHQRHSPPSSTVQRATSEADSSVSRPVTSGPSAAASNQGRMGTAQGHPHTPRQGQYRSQQFQTPPVPPQQTDPHDTSNQSVPHAGVASWDKGELLQEEAQEGLAQRILENITNWVLQVRLSMKVFLDIVQRRPMVLFGPLLLAGLLAGLGLFGVVYAAERSVRAQQVYAQEAIAATTASAILGQVEIATFAIMSLRAYMTQHPDCADLNANFKNLSEAILSWREPGLVYQVQALPAAVLRYIYPPLDSPELEARLIGRDVLQLEQYRNDTLFQIQYGDWLMLGPYDLVEGFKAMFVTYPLFLPAPDPLYDWGCGVQPHECPPEVCWQSAKGRKFWGTVSSLVSIENLQRKFRFEALQSQGYSFRLRQEADIVNNAAIISVSDPPPHHPPVTASISKFNLVWVLEVAPERGWDPTWRNPCIGVVAAGAVVVGWLLLWVSITQEKHNKLLLAMLPRKIIFRLQRGEQTVVEEFLEPVTILFSDIVSYTEVASQLSPLQVVRLLNDLYTRFDALCDKHGVYKVETIGDAFMCVSGCPTREDPVRAAVRMACMAQDMIAMVSQFSTMVGQEEMRVKIRIGLHSGPVVAGVIGQRMPRYCLFGDTVNTASRMETNSAPMCIHVSAATASLLRVGGASVVLPQRSPRPARPLALQPPLGDGHRSSAGGTAAQQALSELLDPRELFSVEISFAAAVAAANASMSYKSRKRDGLTTAFVLYGRGRVMIKGKGPMHTFWLGCQPTPPSETVNNTNTINTSGAMPTSQPQVALLGSRAGSGNPTFCRTSIPGAMTEILTTPSRRSSALGVGEVSLTGVVATPAASASAATTMLQQAFAVAASLPALELPALPPPPPSSAPQSSRSPAPSPSVLPASTPSQRSCTSRTEHLPYGTTTAVVQHDHSAAAIVAPDEAGKGQEAAGPGTSLYGPGNKPHVPDDAAATVALCLDLGGGSSNGECMIHSGDNNNSADRNAASGDNRGSRGSPGATANTPELEYSFRGVAGEVQEGVQRAQRESQHHMFRRSLGHFSFRGLSRKNQQPPPTAPTVGGDDASRAASEQAAAAEGDAAASSINAAIR